MEDKAKILDKIKKLMRLSQSSEPHEAALALQRAKELMDKYQISLADVVLSDIKESAGSAMKNESIKPYQAALLDGICRLFTCEAIIDYDCKLQGYNYAFKAKPVFIGIDPNPEIAAYCFDVLVTQLEKSRAEYLKTISKRFKKANRTRRADDFAFGWASGVLRTVKELVPVFELPEIIGQYMTKKKESGVLGDAVAVKHNKSSKTNYSDLYNGFDAGRKVELNKAVNTTEKRYLL